MAINDPTTAVEATLRLGSLLRQLLTTPLAPPVLGYSQGRLLVRPWHLDYDEYVAHAFDQLRQTAPASRTWRPLCSECCGCSSHM